MGISQPKVSKMMRGEFANLSERKLMDCLNRLGYDIQIRVQPVAEPTGHLTLKLRDPAWACLRFSPAPVVSRRLSFLIHFGGSA